MGMNIKYPPPTLGVVPLPLPTPTLGVVYRGNTSTGFGFSVNNVNTVFFRIISTGKIIFLIKSLSGCAPCH